MRPYERREANAYPYFKLAVWDERNAVWKAGKTAQETEAACKALAKKPGRYRVSRCEDGGITNLEPFTVS